MKILVTGGAGFIASHIVDAYIALGHTVIVLDNFSSGKKEFVNPKAKLCEVDIRDKNEIESIIAQEKPEVINHHAAQISVRQSVADPTRDAEINILGLLNLLEAGRKNNIKKVIFASSGGVVYGEAKTIPTPESYVPLQPLSPYGVTKLASEYYLHFYYQTYHIPYIALRYANVYGPRQNPHGEAGVVAIFSQKLIAGESSVINGDGKQTRDYIYVGDVVEANKKALETTHSGSFNIGTGKETDVIELFAGIKKMSGVGKEAKHGPQKFGEQRRSCLDCRFAQEILGWENQLSLSEGLRKTVDYFKTMVKRELFTTYEKKTI